MKAPTTDAAELYCSAVQQLDAAERAYLAAVDALDRAARDARTLDQARRTCEAAEAALLRALEAAHTAHCSYWRGRRDELRDEIDRIAIVLAEYNALSRLSGDLTADPARQYLQNRVVAGLTADNLLLQDVLARDGVPQEPPDSAALEDYRGYWRRP